MKILAVDDIKQNRYLLRKLLEGYGCTVETAGNGIEALEESRELALEIGAADYIVKPIEPDEFIKIIEEISEKYGKGELKPAEKPLEDAEYRGRYSERLIQKLEKKMHDPERSEAKYRSVVEAVDDLVCLIDREYRFLTWNKKSLERFGLTPGRFLGGWFIT